MPDAGPHPELPRPAFWCRAPTRTAAAAAGAASPRRISEGWQPMKQQGTAPLCLLVPGTQLHSAPSASLRLVSNTKCPVLPFPHPLSIAIPVFSPRPSPTDRLGFDNLTNDWGPAAPSLSRCRRRWQPHPFDALPPPPRGPLPKPATAEASTRQGQRLAIPHPCLASHSNDQRSASLLLPGATCLPVCQRRPVHPGTSPAAAAGSALAAARQFCLGSLTLPLHIRTPPTPIQQGCSTQGLLPRPFCV